ISTDFSMHKLEIKSTLDLLGFQMAPWRGFSVWPPTARKFISKVRATDLPWPLRRAAHDRQINAADSALLELPLCGTRFSSRSRISIDTRSRLNNALSIGLLTWSLCDAP